MTVLGVETHYRCGQLSDLMVRIFPVIRINVLFCLIADKINV